MVEAEGEAGTGNHTPCTVRGKQGTGAESSSVFTEAGVEPCHGGDQSRGQKWRPGPGHSDGGDDKRGERNERPGERPRSGAGMRKRRQQGAGHLGAPS